MLESIGAMSPRRASLAVVPLLPIAAFVWLEAAPGRDRLAVLPSEHFLVVTLVALLALVVGGLVARAAVRIEQYQVLLLALGFTSIAGFFAVHALATPGVLAPVPASLGGASAAGGAAGYDAYGYGAGPTPGAAGGYDAYGYGAAPTPRPVAGYDAYGYGGAPSPASGATVGHAEAGHAPTYDYAGTVVGVSAFLSLFIPAGFFAASYAPIALRLKRRLPLPTGGLVAVTLAGIVLYALLAGWQANLIADLPIGRPPYSYILAAVTVLLLLFAAGHQLHDHRRTGLPVPIALATAFLLLAEAQVLMVVTTFWSLAWWGYHVLMLVAVVLAFGALVVELDRRRGLERFLPAEVVERVVAGDVIALGGDRRVVTVLFADLRGSTALAEQMPAGEVVAMLNAYVGSMATCVFDEDGMLDKFLGDGIMAVFGISDREHHGAVAAVRAARAMRVAIGAVNQARGAAVAFGVGMHTGEVVLGAIGLARRSDFTAIGDAVNTAARLEKVCKEMRVDIVLSEQTAAWLGDESALRALGEVELPGKREPIRAFTVA